MNIREKAIAAIDRAICEPDNVLTSQQAVAAFDAAIQVLMEPDEQFLTGPFEEMLETQGHAQTLAESWRMLLKAAADGGV